MQRERRACEDAQDDHVVAVVAQRFSVLPRGPPLGVRARGLQRRGGRTVRADDGEGLCFARKRWTVLSSAAPSLSSEEGPAQLVDAFLKNVGRVDR